MAVKETMERQPFWVRFAGLPVWVAPQRAYVRWLYDRWVIDPTEEERQAYFAWRAKHGDSTGKPVDAGGICLPPVELRLGITVEDLTPQERLMLEGRNESSQIYTKIFHDIWSEDAIQFHCSALCMGGKAYLFTAPSGTGKSTHTRLWRERFGAQVQMLDDDKPCLRRQPEGQWVAYGMPYGGKEHISANISAPVGAIVEVHRAEQNSIRRITAYEAYPYLLNQTYRYWGVKQALAATMDLVYDLAAKVPVYELHCNMTSEAAELACEALTGAVPAKAE